MINETAPYPSNWEELPDYLVHRISRLTRALPSCRGRASDVKPLVEKEIERLRVLLQAANAQVADSARLRA